MPSFWHVRRVSALPRGRKAPENGSLIRSGVSTREKYKQRRLAHLAATPAWALAAARGWGRHPGRVPAQLAEQRPERLRVPVLDQASDQALAQELAELLLTYVSLDERSYGEYRKTKSRSLAV